MIQIKAWNILNCLFCQYNSNKIHVGSRLLIERSSLQWKIYRITGFFCGCKFLRFVSKMGTCIFCDFIFCDFTSWQSDFYSLDDMKKLRVNLKHPAFYGHVHLPWSQAHFPLYLTHRSTQAKTPVSCSCERKLIGS